MRVKHLLFLLFFVAKIRELLQGLSPPNPNLGHKEQEKEENV